jgi:hypothetical protein
VKRQGRETDHSSPYSAEAKTSGAIPPFPHIFSCMVRNYTIKYKENLHILPIPAFEEIEVNNYKA